MDEYYENQRTFSPFGLSDHNTATVEGKKENILTQQNSYTPAINALVLRPRCMGRYLNGKYWPSLKKG